MWLCGLSRCCVLRGERSVLGSLKWLLTLRFARICVFFLCYVSQKFHLVLVLVVLEYDKEFEVFRQFL